MQISPSTFETYGVGFLENIRSYPVYYKEELVALKLFHLDLKKFRMHSLTDTPLSSCGFFWAASV